MTVINSETQENVSTETRESSTTYSHIAPPEKSTEEEEKELRKNEVRLSHYYRLANELITYKDKQVQNLINSAREKLDDKTLSFISDSVTIAQLMKTMEIGSREQYVKDEINFTRDKKLILLNGPLSNLNKFTKELNEYIDLFNQYSSLYSPSVDNLVKELDYIHKNIGIVDIEDDCIGFETEEIELKCPDYGHCHEFGSFNITISLLDLNIMAEATNPNPPIRDDSVTHPHVKDNEICFGDGEAIVNGCQKQLRILDLIDIINNSLNSYNPDGAYITLDQWEGNCLCESCEQILNSEDDHTYRCNRCEEYICDSCNRNVSSHCNSCGDTLCGSCSDEMGICHCCDIDVCVNCFSECNICGNIYCSECLQECNDCGQQFCKDCMDECCTCNTSFCNECMDECCTCNTSFCNECIGACHQCHNSQCDECISSCNNCGQQFCKDCMDECCTCNTSFCNECMDECCTCNTSFCNECIGACHQCHNSQCDECISSCNNCGQQFCKDCMDEEEGLCESCNDKHQEQESNEESNGEEDSETIPSQYSY